MPSGGTKDALTVGVLVSVSKSYFVNVNAFTRKPSLCRVAASAFLDCNGDSEFTNIERQSHGSHLPSEVVDQAAVPNRHQSERHPLPGGNIISYV